MPRSIPAFPIILLLVCSGCVTKETGQLSTRQILEIKNEVKTTTDVLTARTERLDMQGFFDYCLDSPDWGYFGPDGSRADYRTARTMCIEAYRNMASHKLTTTREDIAVLGKGVAIWGWVGRVEDVLKSGEKATTDPLAVTLVLKKIAGQWKVVWWQTSCGPPVVEKATIR